MSRTAKSAIDVIINYFEEATNEECKAAHAVIVALMRKRDLLPKLGRKAKTESTSTSSESVQHEDDIAF